jgi:hypothetical protein
MNRTSVLVFAFVVQPSMSCPVYLPYSVWFAQQRRVDASRVTVTVARVNFLDGGVLKLDVSYVTRAM